MSVRFYNTAGWMIGVDLHRYQAVGPGVPIPIPFHPHIVVVPLSWSISAEKSRLQNVTSDGEPMLQKGHKLKMIPHVPIPYPLPHLAETAELAQVLVSSKTTCVMGVASVTGGGEPLATCLAGWWGLNVDCFSPVDAPSGHVFNGNTVRTSPTLADYVNAGIDVALGGLEKAIEMILPDGSVKKWFKTITKLKKRIKMAEQVVKYILKKLDKTMPMPSDLEKKIDKKREEFVRKLLGGH